MQTDAKYFLEKFCRVKNISGNQLVPFVFNTAQDHFYRNHWRQHPLHIMGKSRKWGYSTQRIGLGEHEAIFSEGRIFRIVAHVKDTAQELNKTVKLLYETAKQELIRLQEWFKENRNYNFPDWEYFLPRLKYDNSKEYFFPQTQSAIIVDTARGIGVGQSDRSDDLYLTEYAEYLNAEDVFAGLTGSMPLDNPTTRVTVDFNAKGVGNDAYVKYQAAKRGELGEFVALFYGVNDCPELYPAEKLAQKRAELKKKFPAVYPSNDTEMWLKNEQAVFDWDDIQACRGRQYFCQEIPESQWPLYDYYHGIDTATGQEGGDWQVMRGFAYPDGELVEAYTPVRTRIPEDMFARKCNKITRRFPGVVTVERNMAAAVITAFKEMDTPGLAKFKSRDKAGRQKWQIGLHTTYPSKRIMITDMQRAIAEKSIVFVSENGIEEMRAFEWKTDDMRSPAGAPEGVGFHDDEVMAAMMALQGLKQHKTRFERAATYG